MNVINNGMIFVSWEVVELSEQIHCGLGKGSFHYHADANLEKNNDFKK
jgi:hypothetical protein